MQNSEKVLLTLTPAQEAKFKKLTNEIVDLCTATLAKDLAKDDSLIADSFSFVGASLIYALAQYACAEYSIRMEPEDRSDATEQHVIDCKKMNLGIVMKQMFARAKECEVYHEAH